jgi:CubicO group peptidase (beta-lactamase class C family)
VPENDFTRTEKVTLRRVLSHSAGLTVHGFPGYASTETLPTLVQILDGVKPANTAPIRVDTPPGTASRYSGGGYTVLQQMLVDVARRPFPEFMRDTVLQPLHMDDSTYEQPMPAALRPWAATAHDADGKPIPGRDHTYPEMAAAGLWTTPTDLAKFAIEVRQARAGRSAVLSASEILRTVANEYGWPAYPRPREKTVASIDPSVYHAYVGPYEMRPGHVVSVTVAAGKLVLTDGGQTIELLPESATKFFELVEESEIEFIKGPDGTVTGALINGEIKARRIGSDRRP